MTKQSAAAGATGTDLTPAASMPPPAAFYQQFFALVAEKGLQGASLPRLAAQQHWPLVTLRQVYPTLGHVLADFTAWVTAQMRNDVRPDADAAPRDVYFELFMARLDAMQPCRDGLARLWRELPTRPDLALILLRQSHDAIDAMLQMAGHAGPVWQTAVRRVALTGLYARLLRVWIRDDNPDLATTMAFLDEQLNKVTGSSIWPSLAA